MGMLDQVQTGRKPSPRRTLIYGTEGIGKSTWAAMWPKAVFVPTEDSLTDIDAARLPHCDTLTDVFQCLDELRDVDHEYKTVVVDSIDWTEKLVHQAVCESEGKNSIGDFGYGKGYDLAATAMVAVLDRLTEIGRRGIHIVLVGHASITRFEDPTLGSYDRYEPRLHKKCNPFVKEWATEVLFAHYRVMTRKEDQGFGKEKKLAIGSGERLLSTVENAAWVAKNRLNLPPEMPLDFRAYEEFVPKLEEPAKPKATRKAKPKAEPAPVEEQAAEVF